MCWVSIGIRKKNTKGDAQSTRDNYVLPASPLVGARVAAVLLPGRTGQTPAAVCERRRCEPRVDTTQSPAFQFNSVGNVHSNDQSQAELSSKQANVKHSSPDSNHSCVGPGKLHIDRVIKRCLGP